MKKSASRAATAGSDASDSSNAVQSIDWYELPEYYDIVFDPDTEREAKFLEAAVKRYATAPRTTRLQALEPACGTGRLVLALAQRGWAVTGFDASESMLRYARRRVRDAGALRGAARLRSGRMEAFDFGSGFVLAFCLVSTFRYLSTHAAARAHLECVARSLVPGGVYVLGLHLADYEDREPSTETWHVERDGVKVESSLEARPADEWRRTERCEVRIRVDRDGGERRFTDSWTFRTYDGPQILELVNSVPDLELVGVHDFDYDIRNPASIDLEGDRLDVVLILRRRVS